MATLTVGPGKQYATIAAATAAAKAGDTVQVQAGTYTNDDATIKTAITLVAVGGQVTMVNTASAAPAAALLTVSANATITGFTFSGMRNAAGTGAGILVSGGSVTVQNSLFQNNQNGLLATANAASSVTIQNSEFSNNGNGDGFSGNVNVAAIQALTVTGSFIHGAIGGDQVKSLAAATTISATRIEDGASASLYAVETPNGGVVTLSGNTIEKGANATTAASIHFGGGTLMAGSSLAITGNTVVSDKPGAILLWNQTTTPASLNSNTTYGFASVASGPAATFGNTVPAARPTVSTAPLIAAPVTSSLIAPVTETRAGAVTASGHILAVGAGQAFATVAAAIAASIDGDTIQVAAGTYVNDTATITHKVIIAGVGGPVRFVDTALPANGLAQFVTTTDVTFQNIEIFGATGGKFTTSTPVAAILAQGGNLTIDNSDIHDNQAGIIATGPLSSTVSVFDTQISANTANITVGTIGTLTLQNDLVSAAATGPEITSGADNTILTADRIFQAAGNTAPVVALPNGGLVAISSSAIEKALSPTAAPLVQIGGSTVAPGSATTLANDTLISDVTAAPTTFVTSAGSATLAVTATTFVGGTAGSTQVSGGTNTGALTATALTVDTAAPDSPSGAPAAATLTVPSTTGAAQPGQLIVYLSETAYQGDAKVNILVDGVSVAGTLAVTASHAAGQTEAFTIAGLYAPGAHAVAVQFVNSLGAGTTARSLSVDGIMFNGQNENQTATLAADGTATLSTGPVATPTLVTLNLSDDACNGDAQAFITIDGKVQGGVQTIAASHAAGHSQALGFLVDLAPGAHTVGATILNGIAGAPGASRDLYVDSIDIGSTAYASAATSIGASGSSAFAFTVAPPAAANGALFVTSGYPQTLSAILPHA